MPRRDDKRPEKTEPEAMLDGLPMAAWQAAAKTESDPHRLRAIIRQTFLDLITMHASVAQQGGRLPKWKQPSKSIRRDPQKRGLSR